MPIAGIFPYISKSKQRRIKITGLLYIFVKLRVLLLCKIILSSGTELQFYNLIHKFVKKKQINKNEKNIRNNAFNLGIKLSGYLNLNKI